LYEASMDAIGCSNAHHFPKYSELNSVSNGMTILGPMETAFLSGDLLTIRGY